MREVSLTTERSMMGAIPIPRGERGTAFSPR